ncbi:MAG TPA: SDR family oxidoreductase [Acidothermaceae bacterium]
MSVIAVTGSTGAVGGAVARGLAAAGLPIRLVVRDPSRAPQLPGAEVATATYGDAAMEAALVGVQTLFLVSATEDANRVALHTATVDAAVAAGVERIVYLSFYDAGPDSTFTFARDHWHTEQHIRGSGVSFVFLRDNLYLDVLPYMISAEGVVAGPGGNGRFAGVARDDVADVAVTVLLDPSAHDGRTYDLTGPQSISLADVVEAVSAASGRPLRYHEETIDEAYASRAHYGAPRFEVDGWVSTYVAIAKGGLERVTEDVPRLTGHPATSFEDFLRVHPESYAHLLRPHSSAD